MVIHLQLPPGAGGNTPQATIRRKPGDPQDYGLPRVAGLMALPDETLRALQQAGKRRTFPAGTRVFSEGEEADEAWLVLSGEIRRFRTDTESSRKNEVTLSLVHPGEWFGEPTLIRDTRWVSAEATQDSVALRYSRDTLLTLMAQHPLLAISLTQQAMQRAVAAEDKTCNFGAGRWSRRRLAAELLALAEKEGVKVGSGVEIQRTLTQQDLASLIGAARETVSIQLSALRKERALTVKNRRIIVHPDILRRFAG